MTVDILCRVVDNLGDIGFVYRLARALSELPDAPSLRLIVDDLSVFAALCPEIRAASGLQTVNGWLVARWDDPGNEAVSLFLNKRPRMVLECYACGRPDWFESILFDAADPLPRTIINLEYLTAESWAADFHKLASFTRSPLVRKAMFMPGFQAGTGGLLQDAAFCGLLDACASQENRLALRRALCRELGTLPAFLSSPPDAAAFWVMVFSYEHDFSSLVGDLAVFHAERPLVALLAAGRSSAPFLDAWKGAGRPFPVVELPLLRQTTWDAFLAASDFAIVRGEETLSRAALLGRPFLWQCYPFNRASGGCAGSGGTGNETAGGETAEAGGQLPKVYAFLEIIRPFLDSASFTAFERLTLAFNGVPVEASGASEPAPGDLLPVLRALKTPEAEKFERFPLRELAGLADGFALWSQEVRNLGNLASNLLTFMREIG